MQAIVYQADGQLVIAHVPASGIDAADAAAICVPAGTPFRIVEAAALPKDSTYRDAWVANFDDSPCVVTVDAAKKSQIEHAINTGTPDQWFQSVVAEGFATPEGWKLGLTDADVALLTGNFVLAKEADAAGLGIPPVIDRKGEAHPMETLEQLTAIMVAYGQYRAEMSAEYASRKAALES